MTAFDRRETNCISGKSKDGHFYQNNLSPDFFSNFTLCTTVCLQCFADLCIELHPLHRLVFEAMIRKKLIKSWKYYMTRVRKLGNHKLYVTKGGDDRL